MRGNRGLNQCFKRSRKEWETKSITVSESIAGENESGRSKGWLWAFKPLNERWTVAPLTRIPKINSSATSIMALTSETTVYTSGNDEMRWGSVEGPSRSKLPWYYKNRFELKGIEATYQKYNEYIDIGIGNRLENVPLWILI